MLRHLIVGPGPCNFEILEYRLFLESVCVGKQEIGLVSDGHEIPPSEPLHNLFCVCFVEFAVASSCQVVGLSV